MSDAGDGAVWHLPVEPPPEPVPPSHTLVVTESGDPAVDLRSGVVRLPIDLPAAVLPKPVQVEEDGETEGEEGGGGEGGARDADARQTPGTRTG